MYTTRLLWWRIPVSSDKMCAQERSVVCYVIYTVYNYSTMISGFLFQKSGRTHLVGRVEWIRHVTCTTLCCLYDVCYSLTQFYVGDLITQCIHFKYPDYKSCFSVSARDSDMNPALFCELLSWRCIVCMYPAHIIQLSCLYVQLMHVDWKCNLNILPMYLVSTNCSVPSSEIGPCKLTIN